MKRELTGRHVLAIALSAFGVIIAANMAMLFAATGSFPGLVVKNSYVASQGWNARTEAQMALGWTSELSYSSGEVRVTIRDAAGGSVSGLALVATLGRPATDAEDRQITFEATGDEYLAPADLEPGLWQVRIDTQEGPAFYKSVSLFVPGEP
ncbi:MAG: FixH family protein [Pseudomonadota bacterium]